MKYIKFAVSVILIISFSFFFGFYVPGCIKENEKLQKEQNQEQNKDQVEQKESQKSI